MMSELSDRIKVMVLLVGTLYFALYFFLASTYFKSAMEDLVTDAIPGAMTMAAVQWGPWPTRVQVARVRFQGLSNDDVVDVKALDVTIDLFRTLEGVLKFVEDDERYPLVLRFSRVDLLEPFAWIESPENPLESVGIARAFDNDEPSLDGSPPPLIDIRSKVTRVISGGARVTTPVFNLEARGLKTVLDFHLRGRAGEMFWTLPRATIGEVKMQLDAFPHLPESFELSASDIVAEGFRWDGMAFSWEGAEALLENGSLKDSHGYFDITRSPIAWGGAGILSLDGRNDWLYRLTRSFVEGPVDIAVSGEGDLHEAHAHYRIESKALSMGPLLMENLMASGRFSPRPSALYKDRHAILIDRLEASFQEGGQVALDGVSWEPWTDAGSSIMSRDLQFSAELDALSPLVVDPGLHGLGPISGSFSALLDYRAWGASLSLVSEGLVFSKLSRFLPWAKAPVTLKTSLRLGKEALSSQGSDRPSDQILRIQELSWKDPYFSAQASGEANLSQRELSLHGQAKLHALYRFLAALSPESKLFQKQDGGDIFLQELKLDGSFSNPQLSTLLRWADASALKRQVGDFIAKLDLKDGKLRLRQLKTRVQRGETRPLLAALDADLDAQIFAPEKGALWPILHSRMPYRLRIERLHRFDLQALTGAFGNRARLSLVSTLIEGQLMKPLKSLQGKGHVQIEHIDWHLDHGLLLNSDFQLKDGENLSLSKAELTLPQATSPSLRFNMDILGLGPTHASELKGQFVLAPTELKGIQSIAQHIPELSGRVEAQLSLGGSLDEPSLIGTLGLSRMRIGHLGLDKAELSLTTSRAPNGQQQLDISAFDDVFFPGYSLRQASIFLKGFAPQQLRAHIDAENANLAVFVPKLAELEDLHLFGDLSAELDFNFLNSLMAFRVRSKPYSFSIQGGERIFWTNQRELLLVSDGNKAMLFPTTFVPGQASLGATERASSSPLVRPSLEGDGAPREDAPSSVELCGSLSHHDLSLNMQAAVDTKLSDIPWLGNVFSVREGRITSQADPIAAEHIGNETCFNRDDFIHVGGTLSSIALTAQIGLYNTLLIPRGLGREIRLEKESRIALRPLLDEGGIEMKLGTRGKPLSGELDDGKFSLSGDIRFMDWQPEALSIHLDSQNIFVQSTGEFSLSASTIADLQAEALRSSEPKLSVEGQLRINEGRFSKSFDTISNAFRGAFTARSEKGSTGSPIDEWPWLKAARLNMEVSANEFAIQSDLPLAKTDLSARMNLLLQGTVEAPELYQRIDILPGGALSYFVFERTFFVTQGYVSFDGNPERPLVDVTADAQITYLQRMQSDIEREDEKEVTVTLRMTGRIPDLKIELSSNDSNLDLSDIQSLLITGKPRSSLDKSQENQLVSADLSGIINNVLSAPFVKRASVGIDQKGGMEYRVGTCFADGLCLDTSTLSDDIETTLRAKFSLSIGDDVVCEGALKRSNAVATATQDTYQARCRYRIPLD